MYELYLLPIARNEGLEQNQLGGLFTSPAPKHCQRSHKEDRLMLWLSPVIGYEWLPEEDLNLWLKESARIYFNARGSITAGLRECANALNARFLERAQQGKVGAKLSMAVLRGEDFYFAHAGAVYTFLLQDNQMTPFFNTASHSQVLGYVDQVLPQFFQTRATVSDVLLFSPAPAQGWNRQALTFEKRPSLQSVRRRLLANTQGDFDALVLQVQAGEKGEFHRMKLANAERSASAVEKAAEAAPVPAKTKPKRGSAPLKQTPALPGSDSAPDEIKPAATINTQQNAAPTLEDTAEPSDVPRRAQPLAEAGPDQPAVYVGRKSSPPPAQRTRAETPAADIAAETDPPLPVAEALPRLSLLERLPLPDLEESKRRFAAFWLKLRRIDPNEDVVVVTRNDAAEDTEPAPAAAEEKAPPFKLPISPKFMLLVAIAVPLIVAVVAGMVYFQKGVLRHFTEYYDQANLITYQAMTERDSSLRRERLQGALDYLDEAEKFHRTTDSRALRVQIENALDDAAGVVRVELFGAIGSQLKKEIVITRLLLSDDRHLFALDGSSGQVLHFLYDGNTFQFDSSFNCGGGTSQIIDIALLSPMNANKADLLGIDASGTVSYCTVGAPPLLQRLITPVFGWQSVSRMALERDELYVLDPATRALWELYGANQKFLEAEPYLFFSQDAALDLTRVKAMDVYADTIVFVEDNDKVMTCVIDAIDAASRECFYLNPIQTDGSAIALNSVDWTQIIALDYPPSYFLMEQNQKTLYQFSVQMKLNKSYRFYTSSGGDVIPDRDITAFTVTEKQWVLLAFGNQIFMGQLR